MNLPHDLELDALFYWVGNLPFYGISSYTRFDLRVGWRPVESLRLSVVAQNVFERHHSEFGDTLFWPASQVERGIYGVVEWRF
jgi:outer membrane receptor protein involved in Fe transport